MCWIKFELNLWGQSGTVGVDDLHPSIIDLREDTVEVEKVYCNGAQRLGSASVTLTTSVAFGRIGLP